MDNYHIVANKPEHFKRSRTMQGSQMKVFTITNLDNDEKIKISDDETITAQQLREEYHNLLAKKIRMSIRRLEKAFGLNLPTEMRRQKMSDALLRIASSNNRTEAHVVMSYALKPENGELRFYSPLDDPTAQFSTEAMLYSQMRRAIYSGKVNGGSVVQASSFASADDLNVRFYSTNPKDAKYGGVVPTLKEYLRDNKGKSEDDYKKYIKKYQGGYAYFECEMPMPDDIKRILTQKTGKKITDFIDKNGSWDMNAISKVIDPKLLEMVCYRIPTESKYSIMACKVVRFSTEAGGSIAKYPADMITFTGSDFDIDTTYIERRDIISDSDSKNDREEKELNNRLFDLHYAALRANGSLQEAFKNGDFSELSELSYKKVLLEHGYPAEEVDKMSTKELKEACKNMEDLDLMSPVTDDILKSQNSEAKELIALTAVRHTAHGLLSTINNSKEHIELNVPTSTEQNNRIVFINDKNCYSTPVIKTFESGVILDDIYDMDGVLISARICECFLASTDATKDAALYRLNINRTTLPILIFMHRIGVSADIARLLIANPIAVEVCRRINASGGELPFREAIYEVKKSIYNHAGEDEKQYLDRAWKQEQRIIYSECVDAIAEPHKLTARASLGYLRVLSTMSKYSKKISILDNFVRYSSSTAMKHSSFLDRYVALKRMMKINELDNDDCVVKLPDSLEGTCAFDKMCNAFPHIGEAIKSEARLTEQLILDNMHTYNSAFFNIIDKMFVDVDYSENESVKLGKLRDAWRNRLLFAGDNRIADFTKKKIFDKYVTNFANSLDARIAEIEREYGEDYLSTNALINALDVKSVVSNDGKSLTVLDINDDDLKGHDLLALQEDWEKMLRRELTANLAVDIAIHFLAQNAGFKAGSLANAIPIKVKDAIPNYYKAFDDANKEVMTKEEEDKFYIDFVLNNMSMLGITDYVYPISYKKNKNGVYEIKIPLNLSSSRIEKTINSDGKVIGMRYNVPIIKTNGYVFKRNVNTYGAVLLNNGEITNIKEENKELYGTITAKLYTTKGATGEIAEYTGNPKSYLEKMDFYQVFQDTTQGAPATTEQETQNKHSDDAKINALINVIEGSELSISMSPYERMGIGVKRDTNETSLVSSRMSRGENTFEESRMFLSRMDKISSALGIKLSKANRNASSTDASMDFYSFSMEQNDLRIPMRDQAKMLASIAIILSGGNKNALIKEYVRGIQHASHAELSLSIPNDSKKELIDMLGKTSIPKNRYYIKDCNNLIVTVPIIIGFSEFCTNLRNTILILQDLIDRKTSWRFGENINVCFIKREAFDINKATATILDADMTNFYKNELYKQTSSPYRAINRGSSNSEDKQRERIQNIIKLAQRRASGVDATIEDDLLDFFNEIPSHLSSASRSIQSAELVLDVRSCTEGRFDTMLEEQEIDEEDKDLAIDNAIVNTANWLLSFNENDVKTSMQSQGFREKDANSIVEVIKDKLKDLNIC